MPYIVQKRRTADLVLVSETISRVFNEGLRIGDMGDGAFVLYRAMVLSAMRHQSWSKLTAIHSVVEQVAHEFQRRNIDGYEDDKRLENGDVLRIDTLPANFISTSVCCKAMVIAAITSGSVSYVCTACGKLCETYSAKEKK